jgi:hypothetical protein
LGRDYPGPAETHSGHGKTYTKHDTNSVAITTANTTSVRHTTSIVCPTKPFDASVAEVALLKATDAGEGSSELASHWKAASTRSFEIFIEIAFEPRPFLSNVIPASSALSVVYCAFPGAVDLPRTIKDLQQQLRSLFCLFGDFLESFRSAALLSMSSI